MAQLLAIADVGIIAFFWKTALSAASVVFISIPVTVIIDAVGAARFSERALIGARIDERILVVTIVSTTSRIWVVVSISITKLSRQARSPTATVLNCTVITVVTL